MTDDAGTAKHLRGERVVASRSQESQMDKPSGFWVENERESSPVSEAAQPAQDCQLNWSLGEAARLGMEPGRRRVTGRCGGG